MDPLKPVSEQPGGPPQKLIVEVLNANNLGMCQTSTDSKQDFVPPMLNPFFMVGANAMIEESESGGVDLSMKRKKVGYHVCNLVLIFKRLVLISVQYHNS